MEINYFFQNLESSDALKDYARKKIDKVSVHFNSLISANARFRVEKIHHIAEFDLNADGNQFVAEESASDMYAALDQLEKTMERMIRRQKEKNMDKRRVSG